MDLAPTKPSCTCRGVLIEEEAVGVGVLAVGQGDYGEVGLAAGFQCAEFRVAAQGYGAGEGAHAKDRGRGDCWVAVGDMAHVGQ